MSLTLLTLSAKLQLPLLRERTGVTILRLSASRLSPLASRPTYFLRILSFGAFCVAAGAQQPNQTWSGSLAVQGPNPWVDVKYNYLVTGALGDTKTTIDGTIAINSTTLSSTSAPFMTSPVTDVNKSVSVGMYPTTPPLLTTATVSFTSGGNIPAGAIVFYRLTEINSSGEGQPSLEGYAKSSMAGSRLSIGQPGVVGGATAWNVYAAESDITYGVASSGMCNSMTQTIGLCRLSGTVVQAITATANNMYVGQTFSVTGAGNPDFNGVFVVASVVSNMMFTYLQSSSTAHQNTGTATIAPVLTSGSESLQPSAGCSGTMSVSLPTGQMQACAFGTGAKWLSPSAGSGLAILSGGVRPPGVNTSYPNPVGSACSGVGGSGLCQTSGVLALVTTTIPHGLMNNQQVSITGSTSTGATTTHFNGYFKATVTGPTTFTIPLTGTAGTRGGSGVVQPSYVLLSTISAVGVGGGSVTLTDAAWTGVSNVQVSWGTNDTAAIQNAIDNPALCPSSDGCTILLPNGHFWIQHMPGQTYSLLLAQGNHSFFRFAGTGNASSTNINGGGMLSNQSVATSELVSADPLSPIVTIGAAATSLNAGPRFERVGFRDVSGVCASPGGLLFQNVARSRLEDVGFGEFCNGYAVRYDGLTGGVNQFNYLENVTAINVQNGIVFANGNSYDNWIEFGTFYHSQTGGGICVDFQGNQGGTLAGHPPLSGGTNFVMSGSCNFFPIAIHTVDQHADFISTKAENTSLGGGNVVGGVSSASSPPAQSGVGIQIDGSGTSSCFQNRLISPVLGFFDAAIVISANCMSNMIVGASYASNLPTLTNYATPPVVDNGVGDVILDQNGLHFGMQSHLTATGADVSGSKTTTSSSIYVLTFDTPFVVAPLCTATATSNVTMWVTVPLPSGVTFNSSMPNITFNYHCIGNPA